MPKPEDYSERKAQIAGWPVHIITYRLGTTYYTTIDNTDPGAWVVKAQGSTKDASESQALKEAQTLLEKIKKTPPPTGCTSVPGF
ncbi:MAG: hypothetical protein HYY57_00335 [Candidatus Omnitrophica bacterium]|nr:hypothetical protein [Candidatus Omnitrophota bacterium]